MNRLEMVGQEYNMLINKSKTVVMATNGEILKVIVDEKPLVQVQSYQHLRVNMTPDSSCETDFRGRLAKGLAVMSSLKSI